MQTDSHTLTDTFAPIAANTSYAAVQVKSAGIVQVFVGPTAPTEASPTWDMSLAEGDGLPGQSVFTDVDAANDTVYARVRGAVSSGTVTVITG